MVFYVCRVIEKSKENRMQTQNIAIVFGPTLMWPEVESHNVAVTLVYQNQIVEFILLEFKNLFWCPYVVFIKLYKLLKVDVSANWYSFIICMFSVHIVTANMLECVIFILSNQ